MVTRDFLFFDKVRLPVLRPAPCLPSMSHGRQIRAAQELDILVIAAVDVGDGVLHMGCTSILSGLCLDLCHCTRFTACKSSRILF